MVKVIVTIIVTVTVTVMVTVTVTVTATITFMVTVTVITSRATTRFTLTPILMVRRWRGFQVLLRHRIEGVASHHAPIAQFATCRPRGS